jgi:hypothetical protein
MVAATFMRRRLSKKAGLVMFSVLALSLLFNSVVYACSKLGSVDMAMALHGRSMATTDGMNERSVERGPCSQHKQDVCKTVRDRMLSTQASTPKTADYQQPVPLLLPLNLVIDVSKHIDFSFASTRWVIAFHSVFKLPLSLSFSVLRI